MGHKFISLLISWLLCQDVLVAQPQIGYPAPEITLEGIYNKTDKVVPTLASLKGKVVILDFWATWCSPCIAAFPKYDEMMKKYSDRDVHFIAITADPKDRLENFLRKVLPSFWIGWDEDKQDFRNYQITTIPQMFIVNRSGVLVHNGRVTEEMIEEVLATDALLSIAATNTPEVAEVPDVITNGGFTPGEDPLYNGMNRMLGAEFKARPKAYEQFIIRPSLDGSSSYGHMTDDKGHVGVTHYGSKLQDVFAFLNGLSSSVWITSNISDTTRIDVIYWRKASDLDEAYKEIQERLTDAMGLRFDSVLVEAEVNIITTDEQNGQVVAQDEMEEGTQSLYRAVSSFVTLLEKASGEYFLADDRLKEAFVDIEIADIPHLHKFDRDELLQRLAQKGIRVQKEKRSIMTYVIDREQP